MKEMKKFENSGKKIFYFNFSENDNNTKDIIQINIMSNTR